jgi:uncharacterized protein YjaZ
MGVVKTDEWLKKDSNPIKICQELKAYFHRMNEREIHHYLNEFGMYKRVSKPYIQQMIKYNVWGRVRQFFNDLKAKWQGPDIPIFIFPVDESSGLLSRDFRGKSGVSFRDKLFLFLSKEVGDEELKTVLTHEYHHICRLSMHEKKEEHYTLIDAIILEGLAEHAVCETVGEQALTVWVKKYSPGQLNRWWNLWIKPNQLVKRDDPKYVQLLFGKAFYPHMLGYALGYHIVRTYHKTHKLNIKETFTIPVDQIVAFYENQFKNR